MTVSPCNARGIRRGWISDSRVFKAIRAERKGTLSWKPFSVIARPWALAYTGVRQALPSCPNKVEQMKTSFPASRWASSSLRWLPARALSMIWETLEQREGWGWRTTSDGVIVIKTPRTFWSGCGERALDSFIRKPRSLVSLVNWSKLLWAREAGSTVTKSST